MIYTEVNYMIKFRYSLFAGSDEFPVHLQYGFHDKSLYVHSHEDFSELVFVLDGSSEHLVNSKSYSISKGDVFVISNDTEHGFFQPDKMKICNIMFKPAEVFANTWDIRQLPGFQALFVLEPHYSQNYSFCSQLKLSDKGFAETDQLIKGLMTEYNNKPTGWRDSVFSGFIRLCILLSRFYEADRPISENSFLRLADAAAYIENNFQEHIDMNTLAQISGYSERQLIRNFKETYSATPSEYIANLRIKKAKHLLGSEDLSIGEIAWSCGFDDQNYFSRFFKKTTGMTPSAYRSLTHMDK